VGAGRDRGVAAAGRTAAARRPPGARSWEVDPGGVAGGFELPAGGSSSAPSPFAPAVEPGAVLGGVTVDGVAAGPTPLPYGVAGPSSVDDECTFFQATTPPPAAIGMSSSFLPPLPTNFTTLYWPQVLAPFLAVLAAVEPIFIEAQVFAAVLATCAGFDLRLRGRGSAIAVI
jgi:hypothetical protein